MHRALRGLLFNLTLVGLALYLVALPIGWLFYSRMDPAGLPAQSHVHLRTALQPVDVQTAPGTTIEVRDSPPRRHGTCPSSPIRSFALRRPDIRARAHVLRVTTDEAQRVFAKQSLVSVRPGTNFELAGQDVSLRSTAGVKIARQIS